MLRLTYMFAFLSTHDSREMLITFQPPVYFGIISLMGGWQVWPASHRGNAWPSIKTHASVGSSYLGQTRGPSGIGVWGHFWLTCLLKWAPRGEKDAEPHRPYGKRDHWCHLPVQCLLGIGEGLLTAVWQASSLCPHMSNHPSVIQWVMHTCSPLVPAMLPAHSPTSFLLSILRRGSETLLSTTCHGHTDTVHTCLWWSKNVSIMWGHPEWREGRLSSWFIQEGWIIKRLINRCKFKRVKRAYVYIFFIYNTYI